MSLPSGTSEGQSAMFKFSSKFSPIDEQKKATDFLAEGISRGGKNQVLLGVTGSGKTYTMAQVIAKTQLPTLIISHNKTLAGQLYQEMRDFFPEAAVSYFVSYYDFYQPEAYMPRTDTYIEKEAQINETIDKLRLASTSNILTRDDVIVVASVSCIYNIGSPIEYGRFILEANCGEEQSIQSMAKRLLELQYDRSEFDFKRGTFRMRGKHIDIYPAYEDNGYRVTVDEKDAVVSIACFDPLTGRKKQADEQASLIIYPAKHYMADPSLFKTVEEQIRTDLEIEYKNHKKAGRLIEAERLLRRVNFDLEMIAEVGYVNGIENYSRYFDGRKIGEPPHALLDYFSHRFSKDWLVIIDESHMTVPQIRGMYNGDYARKKTLIEYGFRLKSAFDNRPLTFKEFFDQVYKVVYVSATPNEWELTQSMGRVAEQLVRPTGIIDPAISIRPTQNEVEDVIVEIERRIKKGERVLVTTLTKRIAEDLTKFLKEKKIAAEYLHSDIKTLDRSEILTKLRQKKIDVLVGINLLREGLDLPEVTLVAILDADNAGFLRSKTALIQTMGRAARNTGGEIIIYADTITQAIREAVAEVDRRRKHQVEYNRLHNIEPKNIKKDIRENIIDRPTDVGGAANGQDVINSLEKIDTAILTPYDKKKLLKTLFGEMKKQARDLNFEAAIAIREKIQELEVKK